jgi:hypothetical protein
LRQYFLVTALAAFANGRMRQVRRDEHARHLTLRVRTEFLHAWNNYGRYAWGFLFALCVA